MKKAFAIVLAVAMMFALTACGTSGKDPTTPESTKTDTQPSSSVQTNTEKITIRIAHNDTDSESNAYQYSAARFKELVEERSNGMAQVTIYPNGQYGGEREMFEAAIMGTVDLAVMTSGNIGEFAEPFFAVDLPFAFSSSEAAWAALDGPAGKAIGESLKPLGVTGLAWGENGFRNMVTNGHAIKTVSDFKGMKIRALENSLHVASYKAWGANPSPLAWSEVMTGLQQGTIQGLDIPISVAYSNNFFDLAKYYSLTNQFYNAQYIVCNTVWLEGLSADMQDIVKQAAVDACNMERKWLKENESGWLDSMEAKGMTIARENEIDYDSFKKAVADIYDEYAKKIGGTYVYDLLDAAAAAAK